MNYIHANEDLDLIKKISTGDRKPKAVLRDRKREFMNEDEIKLLEELKKICTTSLLSYLSVNKVLYQLDKELYSEALSNPNQIKESSSTRLD